MADGKPLNKPPGFRDHPVPRPPAQQPMGPRKPAGPPAFYQPKRKKRGCCRAFCCCFCCCLLVFIVLLGVACGLFFLLLEPKIPVFRFRPLEMDRFNVTLKKGGTAVLDAKAIVRVEAKNPNGKLNIYYGDTDVTLTLEEDTALGSGSVAAFEQAPNNMTLLRFTLGTSNSVIDSSIGSSLKTKVKDQSVKVSAEVKTKIGIGIGKIKIGMLPVDVKCGGVSLKQLDQESSPPKCSFTTLRWIKIH